MNIERSFPYLEVAGSHRELGEAIGEMFRGKIQETVEDARSTVKNYRELLAGIGANFEITSATFPKLIEELTGVSAAAGVPLNELFLRNMQPVVNEPDEPTRETSETADHCTVAVSFNDNGPIIGHNEDWAIESQDELYVLKATVDNITFLGLNYATYLPGVSATLNSAGLVQCINELPVFQTAGVPKNFIARAILECRSLDEAETLIRTTRHESGYNHVLVQGWDIRDIEVAGQNFDTQSATKVVYAHTNHYRSEHMKKYEEDSAEHHANSKARLKRAYELLRPGMEADDMQGLLSDMQNSQYPICRIDATIGSVIIEPASGVVRVCYGLPTTGEFIAYRI